MNSLLVDGDNINKIDIIKENTKIPDFRIWTQKKNILSDKIFPKIIHHSNIVKKITSILLEQQNEKNTNKSYLYNNKKLKQTSSVKDIFQISPYVKKILGKAKKKIDYVKNSTNEISKMTSLYLEKKYDENESKDISNGNISQFNDLSNEIIKKQKIKNFAYISNMYRKQLKSAFFKFNPLNHLENLKILQKVDPLVKKDYDDLKKSIELEISEITDKHKFSKKYQKIIKINKQNLSRDNIINNSSELNSKINNQNIKLITIKKPLMYFERLKKTDKKKSLHKEEKLEEINILLNSVNSINEQLSNQSINKNIEETYDNYIGKKYLNNPNKITSKYIPDDILELDAIEKMIKMAHLYQAEVVYGSWTRVDTIHHTPTQYSHYPDIQFLSSGQLAMYAFKNYSSFRISVCNALFKLSLIRASHLHFLDAMFWEDLSFTYDLVPKVNRAVLLSDITYHYICRPGSLSQYNDREQLDMEEILRNVSTIDYLKKECKQYEKRDYFPYLCYNLEMNSFYIVCYVLKHRQKIKQTINIRDLQNYMHIPIGLPKLLRFKKKKTACLALWMLPHLPSCLFLYSIRWIGKIKHVF